MNPPRIPHLILISRTPPLADAWRRAIARYFPSATSSSNAAMSEHVDATTGARFTVCEGQLEDLDPRAVRHDCIVSPANSFGIMDGG